MQRYPIRNLAVFGSYARGEAQPTSDIDLLVELEDAKLSLLQFVKIKLEIESALQSSVDLVEYQTIKPGIKDRVLKERISLL